MIVVENGITSIRLQKCLEGRHEGVIINWGCGFPVDFKNVVVLNERITDDKWEQAKLFSASEIPHPPTFLGKVVLLPSVIKHRFERKRKIIYQKIYIGEEFISQEYMKKEKEYRVHIIGNKAVIISEKIPFRDSSFWNLESCHFQDISEYPEELIEIAKKSVNALNYNFGAVDIIQSDGNLYVLEVNSAPGLNAHHRAIYARELLEMVE